MKKIRHKKTGQIAYCAVCFDGPLEGQILVSHNNTGDLRGFKAYKTWKGLWRSWELVEDNA